MVLPGGWTVEAPIPRHPRATGGCFSCCYYVRAKDGTKAFLKALDYSPAIGNPNAADILKFLSSAYVYERDVAQKCGRMDRVVRALDYGQIQVGPDLSELVPEAS